MCYRMLCSLLLYFSLAIARLCGSALPLQGNTLDASLLDKLFIGMSKSQVIQILGDSVFRPPLELDVLFYIEQWGSPVRSETHGDFYNIRQVSIFLDERDHVKEIFWIDCKDEQVVFTKNYAEDAGFAKQL